ncbi:hypothetical protein GDO78_012714 [Eleutherodactylus coqui]|uniref:Uncharacterized protein n=1 Tax=Eleutherodactylus coqui TaxID=57060 RepID=A0A8J6K4A0_ELECQ|nr:hypothetical protein GDO78_012714 [Eleutherodactylus coqui]
MKDSEYLNCCSFTFASLSKQSKCSHKGIVKGTLRPKTIHSIMLTAVFVGATHDLSPTPSSPALDINSIRFDPSVPLMKQCS